MTGHDRCGAAWSGSFAAVVAGLLLATLGLGCADSDGNVAVHGDVTIKDQPLPGGALTFFPASGRPTVVTVAETGQYETRLAPGQYRVTVRVNVELPPGYKDGDPLPPPEVDVPSRYSSRSRTPLTATVAADQSEPIDFDVK